MYSLTMPRAHPYRGFFLAERFDQRDRSSPPPLAFRARWDSNHGVSYYDMMYYCVLASVMLIPTSGHHEPAGDGRLVIACLLRWSFHSRNKRMGPLGP
jgi:hypothetical protein